MAKPTLKHLSSTGNLDTRSTVNLQQVPVGHLGPLVFICCPCGKRLNQCSEAVFADLDGEPFKAYFCVECAQRAAATQEQQA
jgi:hypothetical protein